MKQSFFFRLAFILILASGFFSGFAQAPDSIIHYSFTEADWDVSSMVGIDENSEILRKINLPNGKERVIKADPVSGNQESFEMIDKNTYLYTLTDKSGNEIAGEKIKLEEKPFTEIGIPVYNENGDLISEMKLRVFKFRRTK